MNEFLTAVASFLGENGYGTVGKDLYSLALPDNPHRCTAVIQTGGPNSPGDGTRTPEVTVLHRDKNVQRASTTITSINALLLSNNGFHCLGEFAGRFVASSEPGLQGYDPRRFLIFQGKYTFVTTKQM